MRALAALSENAVNSTQSMAGVAYPEQASQIVGQAA